MAAELQRRPERNLEIAEILEELEREFVTGYSPTEFVSAISALRSLEPETRQRLFDRLQQEFTLRFRPEERLATLRRAGLQFLEAAHAWQSAVRTGGVGADSAPLWHTLKKRSGELLTVLGDPELRTRWIP